MSVCKITSPPYVHVGGVCICVCGGGAPAPDPCSCWSASIVVTHLWGCSPMKGDSLPL